MPCTLRCVEQKWLLFLPSRRRAVFVAACVKCQRSVLISAFVIRQLHTIEDWKGVRYKPDFAPLLSPDSFSLSPILAFALYSLPTRRIWYSERRFLNSLWAPQPLACDLLPAFKLSFVIKEINGLSQGNSEEGKFVRKVGEVLLKFRNPHCFLGRGKLLSFFCSQRNDSFSRDNTYRTKVSEISHIYICHGDHSECPGHGHCLLYLKLLMSNAGNKSMPSPKVGTCGQWNLVTLLLWFYLTDHERSSPQGIKIATKFPCLLEKPECQWVIWKMRYFCGTT